MVTDKNIISHTPSTDIISAVNSKTKAVDACNAYCSEAKGFANECKEAANDAHLAKQSIENMAVGV